MLRLLSLAIVTLCFLVGPAAVGGVEVFAKGSASKSYIVSDEWTTSLSISAGIAIGLFSQVRLEGRFTSNGSLQNKLPISSGGLNAMLTDIKTVTNIYSVGLDIDVLSEKYAFQPYLYVGAGYVSTSRSYYVQPDPSSTAYLQTDPTDNGISGNLGLGFRLRIVRTIALEVEAFAYGINIQNPNPLVNLYGTAGIRIFL